MVPNEESMSTTKRIRMRVGSHLRYSPIPPQTPAIILSVRDFLSFAGMFRVLQINIIYAFIVIVRNNDSKVSLSFILND